MKLLITASLILVSALAAPQHNLKYRNLFKPIKEQVNTHRPSNRIINGEIAEPHSIPYQVFMEVYDVSTSGWYCGGTLISETVVLTAGHCGADAILARVVLGAQKPFKFESEQVIVETDDIVVHEQFDEDLIINDIALIRLKKPVKLSDIISIVKLPLKEDQNKTYVGEIGRVSGWGLTDGLSNQLSEDLRFTENPIISNKECEESFDEVLETQMCLSGLDEHKSCHGDSGGPLTVNGTQVGIVSYGSLFCFYSIPSVFTRISSYLDWIEENSKPQI